MVSPQIRRMRPQDLDRILDIESCSFGRDAYDRNLFAAYMEKWGELALICETGGRVDGYLLGCIRRRRAELVSIAVDPSARCRGAGSALLASFIRRVRARGILHVSLMVRQSNEPAQMLYRKHKFEVVRRVPGYYEDGSDGVLMSRNFA